MTGLLVSVRSAAEAKLAVAGGADVVDVKEPGRGALGPADPAVWHEIQAAIGRRIVTSVALGELLGDCSEALAAQTAGFRYAKIGLAGCHAEYGWIERWLKIVRALPAGVQSVPVAYADWPAAGAPSPSVGLTLAQVSGARMLLIDTYDKSSGDLLDHLSFESLREIAASAHHADVQLALAGSLDEVSIAALLELAPSYVGVRGAVSSGGRRGTIEMARVKSLARVVHAGRKKAAS